MKSLTYSLPEEEMGKKLGEDLYNFTATIEQNLNDLEAAIYGVVYGLMRDSDSLLFATQVYRPRQQSEQGLQACMEELANIP
jgi:hypothetical protein